jgi:hypothetical protein
MCGAGSREEGEGSSGEGSSGDFWGVSKRVGLVEVGEGFGARRGDLRRRSARVGRSSDMLG